jgi:hypothetical protein
VRRLRLGQRFGKLLGDDRRGSMGRQSPLEVRRYSLREAEHDADEEVREAAKWALARATAK